MSSQFNIQLKSANPNPLHQPSPVVLTAISDLLPIVASGNVIFTNFVFRTLNHHYRLLFTNGGTPPKNIVYMFLTHAKLVKLGPNAIESKLCNLMQTIVDDCKTKEKFKKALATLFELYVFGLMKRGLDSQSNIVRESYIFVDNEHIHNGAFNTVDIGVDSLDNKDRLELAECSLSTFTLHEKSVSGQLGFYCVAFEKIRNVVGNEKELIFRLYTANTAGVSWDEVCVSHMKSFKGSSIKVIGMDAVKIEERRIN